MEDAVEVKVATLETFEGETKQVEGGVWLPPSEYLRLMGKAERPAPAPPTNNSVFLVGVGAALAGVALGWWLSRDDD